MIRVSLDRNEFFAAALLGVTRNVESLSRGGTDRFGMPLFKKWFDAVEGACGELAFAKAYGFFWHAGLNQAKKDLRHDVAGYDVKTMSSLRYLLRIRPEEAEEPIWYALVCGVAPHFEVHGCYFGPDVLPHPEWLDDLDPTRPPAYLVPMHELKPVLGPAPQPTNGSAGSVPSLGAPQGLLY